MATRGRPPIYRFQRLLAGVKKLSFGPFWSERELWTVQNAAYQWAYRREITIETKRRLRGSKRFYLTVKLKEV